ncbi:metal-dependent hydrolase [Clostridium sediminicola]|uniref:metal-dependent hydrolase n=1 Tax=Clostridium sediminicola TaxID=3114879 RepID=UPI0031F1DBD1
MKGKTHVSLGTAAYVSLCGELGGFSYLGFLIVIFASLLPDIDHPKSLFNKYILPVRNKKTKRTVYLSFAIIILWYDLISGGKPILRVIVIGLILIAFSTHRNGLTHSLFSMIVFTILAGYIEFVFNFDNIVEYISIGYGMHLIGDMFTISGVPLFYPVVKKKIKFPLTIKMNTKVGDFIEDIISILCLIYLIYTLPRII